MKQKLLQFTLLAISLTTILATFIHGSVADISIFHGMIIHPVFLLAGLFLFAYSVQEIAKS